MPSKNTARGAEGSERAWGLKDIQDLIDLLVEREITEFEMEKDGVKVRIKRGNSHAGNPTLGEACFSVSAPPARPVAPAPISAAVTPQPTASEGEVAVDSAEGLYVMKSPIVGTFYAAPSPNAPPFVKLGDEVQIGHVLCIIEAMKLMNELESEVAGEIVRIYVENGQPVEYGQSLFAIKPSHKK
jgi:acetyl-CoA carboxylase biotin carboxyl carrier protein